MNNSRLLEIIERLDHKAEVNYRAYQETGIQRYNREYQNAQELSDYLRVAENALDDHNSMIAYKQMLVMFCSKAIRLLDNYDLEEIDHFLKEMAYYGKGNFGLEFNPIIVKEKRNDG